MVTWSDHDVGRKSLSQRVLEGFRKAHELAASWSPNVKEFQETPARSAGLPHPMGVNFPVLMTLRYLEEAGNHRVAESPSSTGNCADEMSKTVALVDRL